MEESGKIKIVTIQEYATAAKDSPLVLDFLKLRREQLLPMFNLNYPGFNSEDFSSGSVLILAVTTGKEQKILGGLTAYNLANTDFQLSAQSGNLKALYLSEIVVDSNYRRTGISEKLKKSIFDFIEPKEYDYAWGTIYGKNVLAAPKFALDNDIKTFIHDNLNTRIFYLLSEKVTLYYDTIRERMGCITAKEFYDSKSKEFGNFRS